MDWNVRNLSYDHPELYELLYPEPDEATPKMCLRMFDRYLPEAPKSILDVGCGTGRDLDVLARGGAECWGVDRQPGMIEYAKSRRPHLELRVGDMRTVRLDRTFDAILCMGSALMYALTNADVDNTLATFAAHAHPGTLLVLDLRNAAAFLGGGTFLPRTEQRLDAPGFEATAVSEHAFDRRGQLMTRRRVWTFADGRPPREDHCEYRLWMVMELEHRLAEHGFRTVGTFDNKDLRETDLAGPRMYVAGRFA